MYDAKIKLYTCLTGILTLVSMNTISMVRPLAAEYCLQRRMILTRILHIDLKVLSSETVFMAAIVK